MCFCIVFQTVLHSPQCEHLLFCYCATRDIGNLSVRPSVRLYVRDTPV